MDFLEFIGICLLIIALIVAIPVGLFYAIKVVFGIFKINLTFWQTIAVEFVIFMMGGVKVSSK